MFLGNPSQGWFLLTGLLVKLNRVSGCNLQEEPVLLIKGRYCDFNNWKGKKIKSFKEHLGVDPDKWLTDIYSISAEDELKKYLEAEAKISIENSLGSTPAYERNREA